MIFGRDIAEQTIINFNKMTIISMKIMFMWTMQDALSNLKPSVLRSNSLIMYVSVRIMYCTQPFFELVQLYS